MKYDVIIIGAGVAGLLAMRELAKAGYHICMLEASAKEILISPVNNTIYFAGEAISRSESQGTVESALQFGHDTAKMLIRNQQTEKRYKRYSSSGSRML